MAIGTAESAPRIERVGAHVANLERRLAWLKERLANPDRGERVRAFDASEAKALEAAIRLMQFYRHALDPETDPVLALDELVNASESDDDARYEAALLRAKRVLKELASD
jgi:hypothetical protein